MFAVNPLLDGADTLDVLLLFARALSNTNLPSLLGKNRNAQDTAGNRVFHNNHIMQTIL